MATGFPLLVFWRQHWRQGSHFWSSGGDFDDRVRNCACKPRGYLGNEQRIGQKREPYRHLGMLGPVVAQNGIREQDFGPSVLYNGIRVQDFVPSVAQNGTRVRDFWLCGQNWPARSRKLKF